MKKNGVVRDPPGEPCVFVIFGGTGDLMRRKLLPSLFRMAQHGLLPPASQVLGVARDRSMDDRKFRAWAARALTELGLAPADPEWCDTCLHYQAADPAHPQDFDALAKRIAALEGKRAGKGNRVFYLALPPVAFEPVIEGLGRAGLNKRGGWTRLVVEKPFGHDLASALRLNSLVHTYFDETQVYRIDHSLGKETVQNLLAFRFGNALFESSWNRDHVKSVQISVAEQTSIGTRAGYYENTGALRDMVQNHLTQLLTLTAMEVPAAFAADSIRFEKVKVLRSVAPIKREAIVFGQYAPGRVERKKLPGYLEEPGVAPRSRTETFVAMRLEIQNWRWQGVPFYLRTGKSMPRRSTSIVIDFRKPPVALFRTVGRRPHRNILAINLQPEQGFDLSFEVKSPGDRFTLQTERMQFRYPEITDSLWDGYETLLLEIVRGDQTLFVHADETEASWRLYEPLLKRRSAPHPYPAGSWGPAAADKLMEATGGDWTT
jgi:glucose-6-phosphate 1-dehydrogenase